MFSFFNTVNDKQTLRFFFNLGIENFKNFQNVYGANAFQVIVDGNYVPNDQLQPTPPSNEVEIPQNQIVDEFQQLNLDEGEVEIHTPSKVNYFQEKCLEIFN